MLTSTGSSASSALRAGYVVTLLQPYHENYDKRLRKRPKLHFLDAGLAWWTSLPSNPATTGVLVHGGPASHRRRSFRVRPWWIWERRC